MTVNTQSQSEAKESVLSLRCHSEIFEAVQKLGQKRKWSRSLLCTELLREALIREMKKEGGFDKDIKNLEALR